PPCSALIDDRVPGQPEQPAPEGNAPRLIARERFQGLDEDELRQVLRVARAADAAGDEPIDRPGIRIEDAAEGCRVATLCLSDEPIERFLVHWVTRIHVHR